MLYNKEYDTDREENCGILNATAFLTHTPLTEIFLSKHWRKGKSRGTWNDGITVNE
jgi:hypothetical protein